MKVTLYGTRGSTPGHPRDSHRYGGNTTCVRIESECIPEGYGFAVDAGSGFVDLSRDLFKSSLKKVAVLFTHYHHDHTQGLCLAPHTFAGESFEIWGPHEHGMGPRQVLQRIFSSPLFPVPFERVAQRFKCKPLEHIGTQVLVIHPQGGFTLLPKHVYYHIVIKKEQVAFRTGRYGLNECMIVHMFKTAHPEYTISYRFEERTTGRVFVFLTDQEKQPAMSMDLLAHLIDADVLIMDAQYSETKYPGVAGFGHGTPEYCVQTAIEAGIGRLGLTHHDPSATDAEIDTRVVEAQKYGLDHEKAGKQIEIFACADYMELTV